MIKERYRIRSKSSGWLIVFILLTAYFWHTLNVNSLKGFYRLILIFPLLLTFSSIFSLTTKTNLFKTQKNSLDTKKIAISLVLGFAVSLVFVFV